MVSTMHHYDALMEVMLNLAWTSRSGGPFFFTVCGEFRTYVAVL